MPGLSSRGIFLSYRRADAAPYARLLQNLFSERIPDARVFMDLDSIEVGLDFAEVIRGAVDSCAVAVVLIGRQWATLADEEGRRRLDDPDDYVRFEVQTALERGVRVIPVLVDGARPLRKQQLPTGLLKLARLNALELSYGRYQYDADLLINLIQRVLAGPPGADAGHQPPASADADTDTVTRPRDAGPDGNARGEVAPKDPEPVRSDRVRAARVLADAERVARSMTEEDLKPTALADVARALAATDPDRAARLNADAEDIAQSISDEAVKAVPLANLAMVLAATDPDRAEYIARSITDKSSRVRALLAIAEA